VIPYSIMKKDKRYCLPFASTWVHTWFLVESGLFIFFTNVASVSGLFILDCPFGFQYFNVCMYDCIHKFKYNVPVSCQFNVINKSSLCCSVW
jgi:hypothetical protein